MEIRHRIYYQDRHPGDQFTPDQWMRTTIDALCNFALTPWRRNMELHGDELDKATPRCLPRYGRDGLSVEH